MKTVTPSSIPLVDTVVESTNDEAAVKGSDDDASAAERGVFDTVSDGVQECPSSIPETVDESMGRGHRTKKPSVKLRDYVLHTVEKLSPPLSTSPPRHPPGTTYPLKHFVNCARFSMPHRRFLVAITVGQDPTTFSVAIKEDHWRKAMQVEIQALEKNGTWTITDLPPGKKALGCKWVYKTKYNSDGTIERHKARLVILGNHLTEGIDFTETFAPVAKMVIVCVFLTVAAAQNWELHQMDVHNALFKRGSLYVISTRFPQFQPKSSLSASKVSLRA